MSSDRKLTPAACRRTAMTTTKRPIDDVANPEQNERMVVRKLGSGEGSKDATSPPFVRIAYPQAAPPRVPTLQYPSQLTTFSLNANNEQEFTNSAMRYYCEAPLDADLSYRYENWIKKVETRGRLDGLLKACLRDEAATERKRADIVSWRGVMTK